MVGGCDAHRRLFHGFVAAEKNCWGAILSPLASCHPGRSAPP